MRTETKISRFLVVGVTSLLSLALGYVLSSATKGSSTESPRVVGDDDPFSSETPFWEAGLREMAGRWESAESSGETVVESDFHLFTILSSTHWTELSGRTFYVGYPRKFIFGNFIYDVILRAEDPEGRFAPAQGPFLTVSRESLSGPQASESLIFVRASER